MLLVYKESRWISLTFKLGYIHFMDKTHMTTKVAFYGSHFQAIDGVTGHLPTAIRVGLQAPPSRSLSKYQACQNVHIL